jgi:hypothetical protein
MSAQPSPLRPAESHLHLASTRCPTCDQPVATEKLNEITAKLTARDQQTALTVREQLNRDFAARIAEMDANAKAELQRVANDNTAAIEKLKKDADEREAAARRETEAALEEKLAEAARQRQEAEDASAATRAELQSVREAGDAALARAKEDSEAREAIARAEATEATEARLRGRMDEAARLRAAAEETVSTKVRELEDLRTSMTTAIESLKTEIVNRETAARADAMAQAEASWRALLEESDKVKEAAEAHAAEIAAGQQARLDELRAALERAKDEAVNAEKAKAFDDKLKLETQLLDLSRQLQKKTADELGEGAEVKLLEELKARFDGDNFDHVGKGNPGADIIQEVVHNGKVCGKIVFDSKDRSAWRNEYVSKLRKDQVAAEADHAILSARVMPAGTKQMHIQDGVIIANPARVLTLVEFLRQQIITFHKLRLSTESKEEKTAELYAFMTSELCSQLFYQIETRAADMEELDVKEKKAHETVWKRRGELIRSIQKARGDLGAQIEQILGSRTDASDTEE